MGWTAFCILGTALAALVIGVVLGVRLERAGQDIASGIRSGNGQDKRGED